MATVRVQHQGVTDLASDCRKVTVGSVRTLSAVVARNVAYGRGVAQRIARGAAGPHGRNYYKRITSEMTGPFTGEFGPHGDVVGNAVGAGWRHGPPNTDLEKSQDIVGPKFAEGVLDAAAGLFWPGS